MPDPTDSPSPIVAHSGPFFATWGSRSGPILRRDEPPALGVVADRDDAWPIGIAYPVGQVDHPRGPAATFRLVIDKTELDGRWICIGRVFILLGDAAEEV